MKKFSLYLIAFSLLLSTQASFAAGMTNDRLHELITRLAPKPGGQKGYWEIEYRGVPLLIITAEKANRMRIVSPIKSAKDLSKDDLFRMMQANFDSALDARYAIAKGQLWATFIHSLSELTDEQFLSGLAQTISLVQTYGDTYSSGALVFNGGDSNAINKSIHDEILKKGLRI